MRRTSLLTTVLCAAVGATTLAAQQPGAPAPDRTDRPEGRRGPRAGIQDDRGPGMRGAMRMRMGAPGMAGVGPGAGRGAGPIGNPAGFLLAHTGELRLTDAQVTRLAAIARRAEERRQTMRSRLDSLRPSFAPGARPDSAARAEMRQRVEQMRPEMERLREQAQADRRDAIAVLTPEQQAMAWERIAASPRGGVRAGGPQRGRDGMRQGFRQGRGGRR